MEYKGQTLKLISVETGSSSLGSATVKRILYEKPGRQTGYFEGTASGTKLTYQPVDGDIDQTGLWKFQSYIEISGKKGYGDITTQYFETPIS
jgi:hypothetical protein